MKRFHRDGITLSYSYSWRQSDELSDSSWATTLEASVTAFILLSLRPEAESPAQVIDEVLAAFRSDYEYLDAEPVVQSLAGLPALGHNFDFVTLDTTITAWSRAVETPRGILLVLGQCRAQEVDQFEPAFLALLESMQIEGD